MKREFSADTRAAAPGPENRHTGNNPPRRLATLLFCLMVPTAWATGNDNAADPIIDDVRVLIDISGSMKRTDPHNLRRPALRLFTSLLSPDAEAGVWTFGQWTNMLIKHGPVNTVWKKRARRAAARISSHGLHTNIEDVLRHATWDWKRPDASHRRSLILLTDGLVDVSKNTGENTASRQRILNEILPRLQQAGVIVHTIALSSESDIDLLEQLAATTTGWFETVESADGLERLFLRMFEKVSKADTLPLINNRVEVDNSIHEATFLVFRKPGSVSTTITPPGDKAFGRQHLPAGVEWHESERYNLITVQDPAPGEWAINADMDPDNRVMVITDLRMKSTELPGTLAADRPLLITLQLEQQGKIIDRPDFLQFVTATLTQRSVSGNEQRWQLHDDGKLADLHANDGIFSIRLDDSLTEGEYEFILEAGGITFKRNRRQQVKVREQPVKARFESPGHNRFALTIIPYTSLINTETMRVAVEHVLPSGRLEKVQVEKISAAEWHLELDTRNSPGEHKLTAHVTGQRHDGSTLNVQLEPVHFIAGDGVAKQYIESARPRRPGKQHKKTEHKSSVAEHHEKVGPQHATNEAENTDKPPPSVSWSMIIGVIIGLTVLLVGLIFTGIRLWSVIKARSNQEKPVPPLKPEPSA